MSDAKHALLFRKLLWLWKGKLTLLFEKQLSLTFVQLSFAVEPSSLAACAERLSLSVAQNLQGLQLLRKRSLLRIFPKEPAVLRQERINKTMNHES
eukprot:s5303_g2.t1